MCLLLAHPENDFTKSIILCHYDIYIHYSTAPTWHGCSTSVQQKSRTRNPQFVPEITFHQRKIITKYYQLKNREITDVNRIVIFETKHTTLYSDL
jgi:hypothetical protein